MVLWLSNLIGRALRGDNWQELNRRQWPGWVVESAIRGNSLRSAWEDQKVLYYRGRTYEYHVWPITKGHGEWDIGRIQRRRRRKKKRRKR